MFGMMSHNDIINSMDRGELFIVPAFYMPQCINPEKEIDPDKKEKSESKNPNDWLVEINHNNRLVKDNRLTPAGFNFSFTPFLVSLEKKDVIPIYEEDFLAETKGYVSEVCFDLDGGDTALALTRESIWVSGSIAGTFHSKVRFVAEGFSHVSTTLDPGWQGQLLITVHNPSKNKKRVVIGKRPAPDKEDEIKEIEYMSFITLCLYKLCTPATCSSDNTYARLDTIEKVLLSNKKRTAEPLSTILTGISELKNIVEEKRTQLEIHLTRNLVEDVAQYKNFDELHNIILSKLEHIFPKIERKSAPGKGAENINEKNNYKST
jgi:deoxycytidine triphosphate deaminase